mgnify:CR=1 FL=1
MLVYTLVYSLLLQISQIENKIEIFLDFGANRAIWALKRGALK